MGKVAPKRVNEKVEEGTLNGVTVGMGMYKPIPRFNNGCKNC